MSKEQRYDRQLRLWEASGQHKLENGHLCVINASVVASEVLKNLVLPGIGKFSLIDARAVEDSDIDSGFFLDSDDLGASISEAMVKKLCDLNPDVQGQAIKSSVRDLLACKHDWTQYSVVVVTAPHVVEEISQLKDLLWALEVPMIVTSTIGFYGYMRMLIKECTVVETHPESLVDLRIDKPWPELEAYVDSINLSSLDDTDHAHVPYVVILNQALKLWRQSYHGDKAVKDIPSTFEQRESFKKIIISMARTEQISGEANFEEAVACSWRACQNTVISNHIQDILANPAAKESSQIHSLFWVYICALKRFLRANNNVLPLSGVLPDMISDTKSYVELQSIYREKAQRDQDLFKKEVINIKTQWNLPFEVNDESIKTFCKNSRFLYVSKGIKNDSDIPDLNGGIKGTLGLYIAMTAIEQFIRSNKKLPMLTDIIDREHPPEFVKAVQEMLVHFNPNYHNLCSFMGGIVGQECLKLITQQYRPLSNIFVYDGVHSLSEKL